jgi:hypothetical protein
MPQGSNRFSSVASSLRIASRSYGSSLGSSLVDIFEFLRRKKGLEEL